MIHLITIPYLRSYLVMNRQANNGNKKGWVVQPSLTTKQNNFKTRLKLPSQ
jgi:hypothetical protein